MTWDEAHPPAAPAGDERLRNLMAELRDLVDAMLTKYGNEATLARIIAMCRAEVGFRGPPAAEHKEAP